MNVWKKGAILQQFLWASLFSIFFHFLPWTNKLKMHSTGNFLKQVSWGSQGLAGFPKKLAISYWRGELTKFSSTFLKGNCNFLLANGPKFPKRTCFLTTKEAQTHVFSKNLACFLDKLGLICSKEPCFPRVLGPIC